MLRGALLNQVYPNIAPRQTQYFHILKIALARYRPGLPLFDKVS